MDTPIMPTAGELLEKGKQTASDAVRTTASDISTSISDQVGITNETNSSSQNQNTNQGEPQQQTLGENQRTKEMVQDFYSPSEDYSGGVQTQTQTDEQKLIDIRKKIHQERHNEVYYQQLISYEQTKPEERPAEKIERQQMEELQLKEEKKQTELPNALQRIQTHTERSPGMSG